MRTIFALLGALLTLPLVVGCPPVDDDDAGSGECTNFSGHYFPEVAIESPRDNTNFTNGQTLNFIVLVTDEDSDLTEMTMIAEDTVDGTNQPIDVDVPAPDASGRIEFTIAFDDLDQGPHTVRVSATDTDGCKEDDSVVVCIEDSAICP